MRNEYAETMKKTFLIYPVIYIVTLGICLLFLYLTALIPQQAIREHAAESATYFMNRPLFHKTVGNLENFKTDNYADCISTGIAWHFGEGDAYRAIMAANYNRAADENVNVSFEKEMLGEGAETESYARYWHGSAGVIRVLLLVTDIEGIRLVTTIMGLLLNGLVVVALIKKKQYALGIFYAVAFLAVNGVFALSCLEYAFVFLLMPVITLFLLLNKNTTKPLWVQSAFLVTGMLTAFFDFLTAETLTFTVPFALYYITVGSSQNQAESRKIKRRDDWLLFMKSGMCWCIGYAGMFLSKWGLAAGVLGKGAFVQSFDMAKERISGDVSLTLNMAGEKADLGQRLLGIFQRNAGCLYWGTEDMTTGGVVLITLIAVAVVGIVWYMARKEHYTYDKIWILAAVAFIPVIRFLVVSNHAYIHYFFTYRALLVTVMITLYIVYETTVLSERKGKNRRKKHGRKN